MARKVSVSIGKRAAEKKRLSGVRIALGNAAASGSLNRARRKMNPSSAGPQVKRFGVGKGGGVRHSPTTGRFV